MYGRDVHSYSNVVMKEDEIMQNDNMPRPKHQYRKTGITFSFLIHRLYGDRDYRAIKSYNRPASLRKYYLKIVHTIRLAVEDTILITDAAHRKEMHALLSRAEDMMKMMKTFEDLDQYMVAFQAEFIFLLIGAMPSRWKSKQVINKKNNWKLNGARQIQYTQSAEQKKLQIFAAVQGKYEKRFGEWGDFVTNVYWKACGNSPDNLIEWVKKNHPDMYVDLF